jgi:hypothetical protein
MTNAEKAVTGAGAAEAESTAAGRGGGFLG